MSPKSLVILAVSGMLLALFVLDPAFASTSDERRALTRRASPLDGI